MHDVGFAERAGRELPRIVGLTPVPAATRVEVRVDAGGLTNVGCVLHAQGVTSLARIGTMVAGNSGRPGGACGAVVHVDGTQIGVAQKLHARHTTQEEDVVSNWLLTAEYEALRQELVTLQGGSGPWQASS